MSNVLVEMSALAQKLVASASEIKTVNIQYMKFAKGEWSWGAEETEVEKASLWVVNPQSFVHGWIGWGDKAHKTQGERLGEKIVPVTEDMPLKGSLPDIEGEWMKQIGFQLLCLSGDDRDVAVMFKGSSKGALDLYSDLVTEVSERIISKTPDVAPVVMLEEGFYKHKTYGRIAIPAFEYVEWVSLAKLQEMTAQATPDDDEEEEEIDLVEETVVVKETVEVVEEPKPTRTRRKRAR